MPGQRRDDEVERVGGARAVGGGVGERADDLQLLDDRSGPAVGDDHRQGVLVLRAHVDEVDVEPVDLGDELRKFVEPCLHGPPVVPVDPALRELLHDLELHALRRVADGLVLGPSGLADPAVQVVEVGLRDVDPERADGGAVVALVGVGSGLGDGHDVLLRNSWRRMPHLESLAAADPAASVGVRNSRRATR